MDTWVTSASNGVLKALYDLTWALAGGVVGDATYNNALASMGSEIITIVDSSGVPVEFVRSNPQVLINSTSQFLDNFPIPKPCSFRPPGFDV